MKPAFEKEPASSSSEDDHSSSEDESDHRQERIRKAAPRAYRESNSSDESESEEEMGSQPKSKSLKHLKRDTDSDNSSSEEEDSDSEEVNKHAIEDSDDQWSDEEVAEEQSELEDEDIDQSLSLKERLKKQEEKRAKTSTTDIVKDRRERRNKAVPIAKERLKAFKKKLEEENTEDEKDVTNKAEKASKMRKSKHAPTEVSSRRRQRVTLNESGIGVEIGSNRYQPRDPRISNLSGHLDIDQFENNYGFLKEMQAEEMKTLKRKIKAMSTTGRQAQKERRKLKLTPNDNVEALQKQLQKLQQAKALQEQQALERKTKRAVKQKLHAQVAEGKGGVYYPKRRELKRMQMEAKVEQIKKQKGKRGLDKYLVKKRKRQKSQLAKKMRSVGDGGRRFEKDDV